MDRSTLEDLRFGVNTIVKESDFAALNELVVDKEVRLRNCRFYRLDELLYDGKHPQRDALQNVLAAINVPGYNFVYVIRGDGQNTRIYLGVSVKANSEFLPGLGDYANDVLEASFQGMFRGSRLHRLRQGEVEEEIFKPLDDSRYLSVAMGIPSLVERQRKQDDNDYQGIDRLISAMHGEKWLMIIVCEPIPRSLIGEMQEKSYSIYSSLAGAAKQSRQESSSSGKGSSESVNNGSSSTTGTTMGTSISETSGSNTSESHSTGTSDSRAEGKGETISASVTTATNSGKSTTDGSSKGSSHTEGTSKSNSKGKTASSTSGNTSTSDSSNKTGGSSESDSSNTGTSHSETISSSSSNSETNGKTRNSNTTDTHGTSSNEQKSTGTSISKTEGKNEGTTNSSTVTKSQGKTLSENTSKSVAVTKELVNKKTAEVLKYIDEQLLPRLQKGLNKGMFKTAVYLLAENKSVNRRLCNNVKAIFQSDSNTLNPLTMSETTCFTSWIEDFCIHELGITEEHPHAVLFGMPFDKKLQIATFLNSNEVSILASIPLNEVPGVALRQYTPFGLNVPPPEAMDAPFEFGKLIYGGGVLNDSPVYLDQKVLNKHVFVTGLTGSGKTMTCKQLLTSSKSNFLVIEPAKTEYRDLLKLEGMENVIVYSVGNEKGLSLRFNPFEMLPDENLTSHIDMVKAAFVSSLDFEASMPQILEIAMYQAYKKKGWDTEESFNPGYNPQKDDGSVWPTLNDVLCELESVVRDQKFGAELEGNYRGSLISRIKNLTYGAKGKMLNCQKSINFSKLLHSKVVFELEELKSPQDKALIMALIMGRLAEAVKLEYKANRDFRHISIIEEAHRLLSKAEPMDGEAKRYSVSMFTDMLAEIRKYGESMIIVDQIPNKVADDVLKNTATKIVHKIVAKDDKEAIGDTMMLSDEQKTFLSNLLPGCAVVFTENWNKACFVQVNCVKDVHSDKRAQGFIAKSREKVVFENLPAYYPELNSEKTTLEEFRSYRDFGAKYIAPLHRLICSWRNLSSEERVESRELLLTKEKPLSDKECDVLVRGFVLSARVPKIRNADEQGLKDLRKMIMALFNREVDLDEFGSEFKDALSIFKVRR